MHIPPSCVPACGRIAANAPNILRGNCLCLVKPQRVTCSRLISPPPQSTLLHILCSSAMQHWSGCCRAGLWCQRISLPWNCLNSLPGQSACHTFFLCLSAGRVIQCQQRPGNQEAQPHQSAAGRSDGRPGGVPFGARQPEAPAHPHPARPLVAAHGPSSCPEPFLGSISVNRLLWL